LEHLLDALHPPDYYQRFRCGRGHRDRALPYSKPDQLGEVHVEDGDPGLFSCRRNLRDGAVGEDHGRYSRGDHLLHHQRQHADDIVDQVLGRDQGFDYGDAEGDCGDSRTCEFICWHRDVHVEDSDPGPFSGRRNLRDGAIGEDHGCNGATIYYTTNGSTPSGAIKVSTTETVKAIAVAAGHANSSVATATYTLKTATPVFSPARRNLHDGAIGEGHGCNGRGDHLLQ